MASKAQEIRCKLCDIVASAHIMFCDWTCTCWPRCNSCPHDEEFKKVVYEQAAIVLNRVAGAVSEIEEMKISLHLPLPDSGKGDNDRV